MTNMTTYMIDRRYPPHVEKPLQIVTALALAVYAAELTLILTMPELGLRLLWFATIPLAPMILLVLPNVWVSVCPISTVQTITHRFGRNPARRLSAQATARLQAFGWVLLFVGVPSRHLIFNTVGWATFAAAIAITGVIIVIGSSFRSLSGWCVGACPIRPIEVLYGGFAVDLKRPEKCTTCTGCISNCLRLAPDKAHDEFDRSPLTANLAMGFPGFVVAYFLLDRLGLCTAEHEFFAGVASSVTDWFAQTALVYGFTAAGTAVSWLVFRLLSRAWDRTRLFRAIALTAFGAYYLGVAPEICKAWNLPMWVAPLLLLLPTGAVVWALVAGRNGRNMARAPA